MKLCFVSLGHWSVDILQGKTSSAGGAETQIALLAKAFADLGYGVDLIYRSDVSRDTVCTISNVRCINAFPSWKQPGSLMSFWRALEESAPDLIYTRLPLDFMYLIGLFVRRHRPSKFIYALGNDPHCNPWRTYSWNGWFHNSLYALGLRAADYVAVQHAGQIQMVKPYINGQVILIPNLARRITSESRQFDETTIEAIWISHIRPQKQLSIFLDIAEQLPEMHFVVIGGFGREPNRSELERRMQSIRNLQYEGPLPFENVIHLLKSSRVLVNTSSWEGFPNTMLDAWSLGVPVVSLQINPGGVINREGIGVVSGSQSQMVHDITMLVEDSSLNYEMGNRGQKYVQEAHSIDAVCRAFEQIVPSFKAYSYTAREETA